MKLYHAAASPFVRKVMVTLHELSLMDQVEIVSAATTPMATDSTLAAKNPLGKIPALEREGGATLYDSRVICRYLDDVAGGRLYPAAPRLWETLTLEATADGIMEAAVLMVYEIRCRPEATQDGNWIEAQWQKIDRALDAIEARWMAHLAGPLDAAQVAVGCTLGYLDFRHDARDWRAGRPDLAAWDKAFAARDSMAATTPS